jgi:hydroxymethylpyrimidine/phosphomethylpyrimidine kinase
MSPALTTPPVTLSIAGSDCSAGAGLQADLKTFSALGVYGLTVVTCLVAEIPGKVARIQPAEPEMVAEQLRLLLSAFPVAAIKTGMLWSAPLIRLVADALSTLPEDRRPWLVVDPVMVATSGDALIEDDAVSAYREALFPMADLITPNMDEAAALLGRPVGDEAALPAAARDLVTALGAPVLLKGGHLHGGVAVDVFQPREGPVQSFTAPYFHGVSTHGTGCTLSAAITAGLARGLSLPEAIGSGKNYVSRTIRTLCRWNGVDALNHTALK